MRRFQERARGFSIVLLAAAAGSVVANPPVTFIVSGTGTGTANATPLKRTAM